MGWEAGWLETGRRALCAGHWHVARFAGRVLAAVDPTLLPSGKLWFAAVACFFTGAPPIPASQTRPASRPVLATTLLFKKRNG